jgi:hypothetical protein
MKLAKIDRAVTFSVTDINLKMIGRYFPLKDILFHSFGNKVNKTEKLSPCLQPRGNGGDKRRCNPAAIPL